MLRFYPYYYVLACYGLLAFGKPIEVGGHSTPCLYSCYNFNRLCLDGADVPSSGEVPLFERATASLAPSTRS
jgi:hypothetical protein